jgi:hypothetical protein
MVATLLRSRISVVWLALIGATSLSWWLGAGHGIGSESVSSLVVILVAVSKQALVGSYFMELRHAPVALRSMFAGYCLTLCGLLLGMFLLV